MEGLLKLIRALKKKEKKSFFEGQGFFFQICQVVGLAIMDTKGMNQIWLEVRHES
jgi:hypothetical protein